MKKLLFVLTIAGLMTACKSKKADEKKADETTTAPTTEPAKTESTTATTSDVPSFSDPEVQKFVNDYTAFVKDYKAGLTDPAKAQALAKSAQEWSAKMATIGMKIATNPGELKKWTEWAQMIAKEFKPVTQ